MSIQPGESSRSNVSGSGERMAMLFIHGMGQQVRYQTLESVYDGLGGTSVQASTLFVENREPLQRLTVEMPNGESPRRVDLYEAYWAPITEGNVSLRDVMRFLIGGAWNGLRKRRYSRWIWGESNDFAIPLSTPLQLAAALMVVFFLALMNLIAGVAVFGTRDPWVPEGVALQVAQHLAMLLAHLVPLGIAVISGLILRLAYKTAKRRSATAAPFFLLRHALASFSLIAIYQALAMITVIGSATALLLAKEKERAHWLIETSRMGSLPPAFLAIALLISLAAVGALRTSRRGRTPEPQVRSWSMGLAETIATFGAVLFGIALVCQAGMDRWFLSMLERLGARGTVVIVWGLVAVLSFSIRSFLVQYVGDVAVYVSPHMLDRFCKLRQEIQQHVRGVAKTILEARNPDGEPLYSRVAIVGHSLGSVLAYDTVNRLFYEADLEGEDAIAAMQARIRLLLTMGSPLNKTAYVFSTNSAKTAYGREALGAQVQPLIREKRFRSGLAWINIWSINDVISGKLRFYDPAKKATAEAVRNIEDPATFIPLAAHGEYWDNDVFFEVLRAWTRNPTADADTLIAETSCSPKERVPILALAPGM